MLIGITAITLIFGSPLLIVAAVLYSNYRKKRFVHDTINQYYWVRAPLLLVTTVSSSNQNRKFAPVVIVVPSNRSRALNSRVILAIAPNLPGTNQ